MAQLTERRASPRLHLYSFRVSRSLVRPANKHSLYFSTDARIILSPFKRHVLHMIYASAKHALGTSFKTADVSVHYDYYEHLPPSLVLRMIADIDGEQFSQVHDAIVDAIAAESVLWSEANENEYRNEIFYEVIPANL